MSNDSKKEKGFFGKLFQKIDKAMLEKSQETPCCGTSATDESSCEGESKSKKSSCC